MSHQHWSQYWQTGVQTSLPQDFQHNYDGEIYSFWQKIVTRLETGAHVLDVCTGNGAVALIVADIAIQQGKQFHITAVDISDINTDYIQNNNPAEQTEMINFISQCPVERLDDFVTTPQDIIVSQYGLEYSDIELTSQALAKVLKPQGELVFIAHSPQSAVFDYMAKEETIYKWLQQVGLLELFNQFSKSNISAGGFKNKLQEILKRHKPDPSFKGQPLFQNWLQIISQLRPLSPPQIKSNKKSLYDFTQQHQFARQRANDMLKVAVKVKDENWIEPLLRTGFKLKNKSQLIYREKHLVGDCFELSL